MKSSFVQRLKNQKHQAFAIEQSEEKSNCDSIKIKTATLKNPKRQVKQHCQDIKKLLSILGQIQNPQSQANLVKISQNVKCQQNNKFIQNKKLSSSKKENQNQISRKISGFCQKNDKNKVILKSQQFENEIFISLERQDVQTRRQGFLRLEIIDKSANNMTQYHFLNKRKENVQYFASSQKIIEIKEELKIPKQKNIKPQLVSLKKQNQKRGLQNIGNTCYINSIVQCLFHLSSFNTYFMKEKFLKEKSQIVQKFNSDRSIIQKYCELYSYVINGISNQGQEIKSAYSLKVSLSKSCSLFLDWLQQDAHQFLRKLLDSIHQEINRGQKSSPYKLLKTKTKIQYSTISSLADEYLHYYKQKDDSYIYDSFGGQLYSNIKCINCKNQSISFENCLDISLPLCKGKNSLYELMDEFFGDEKLTDFYRCQFCGQINKNSTKTTKLWRTPEILIIQLKRSQFGKKNQQPISFPVDLLNLKNYINSESDKLCQKYASYCLKSVVCHRGATQGGHYWAMIKEYGQWYQIDDQKVNKLNNEQTKTKFQGSGSSQAYLLFYESLNR